MARLPGAVIRSVLLSVLLAFATNTLSFSSIQEDATTHKGCPVTKLPTQPFVPPSPYPADPGEGRFWFGTEKLWTHLFVDGRWRGLPTDSGYRDKVFWWRRGYNWRIENPPKLTVTARRLDSPAPRLVTDEHANAGWTSDRDHPFIVTGIDIPTAGCWQITGDYKGDRLTFVVWVAP